LFVRKYRSGNVVESDILYVHLYAAALLLSLIIASFTLQQLNVECIRVGVQARTALMVLTFRKTLRLNAVNTSNADVINLIADDANKIAESMVHKHYIWSSALEIIVVIALAFVELRLAALPALVALVVFLPLQYYLGRLISENSSLMAASTTERVHRTSEVLSALKLVKFFTWENFFKTNITTIREEELRHLRNNLLAMVAAFAVVFVSPVLITVLCLVLDRALYGTAATLTPFTVFTLLSVFNTLRYATLMSINVM
jgi:ABC-type transport system involved in cytochrome bd biosynthesis fused ATPase/permease subunit